MQSQGTNCVRPSGGCGGRPARHDGAPAAVEPAGRVEGRLHAVTEEMANRVPRGREVLKGLSCAHIRQHKHPRGCALRIRAKSSRRSHQTCCPSARISLDVRDVFLLERNFNFAAHAIGWKCKFDSAAEFIRNEIPDEVATIAGLNRRYDRRTGSLAPYESQRREVAACAVPADRNVAIWAR
jgi:hypothetical protein